MDAMNEPNPFDGELRGLVLTNPLVLAAYTRYELGELSLQEALVLAVKTLATQNAECMQRLVHHYSVMPPSTRLP